MFFGIRAVCGIVAAVLLFFMKTAQMHGSKGADI